MIFTVLRREYKKASRKSNINKLENSPKKSSLANVLYLYFKYTISQVSKFSCYIFALALTLGLVPSVRCIFSLTLSTLFVLLALSNTLSIIFDTTASVNQKVLLQKETNRIKLRRQKET